MIQTIFSILVLVACIVSVISLFTSEYKKLSVAGVIVFGILFVLCSTFTIVPSGSSGVVSTFGKVSDNVMESGMNFKLPIAQKIVIINNQVQRADVDGEGASKDLQTVSYNVSLNYNVVSASSASLYRTVGKDWETIIIRPAVQEAVKSAFAKYTAEELITKRTDVSSTIKEDVFNRLSTYGISVAEFNILNMSFSAEFNAAIEAKQTAQQNALKAEQDLARIKVEAEQKVVEAEAEAKANALKSESITEEILMDEFLTRWNGSMPYVIGSDGLMIDISSVIGNNS